MTQIGFLRVMTTSAAMDGIPLTLAAAWRVHHRLYGGARVEFLPDSPEVEPRSRKLDADRTASPKLSPPGGAVAAFDRTLAARGDRCLLPE
jgi:hypothetical protein